MEWVRVPLGFHRIYHNGISDGVLRKAESLRNLQKGGNVIIGNCTVGNSIGRYWISGKQCTKICVSLWELWLANHMIVFQLTHSFPKIAWNEVTLLVVHTRSPQMIVASCIVAHTSQFVVTQTLHFIFAQDFDLDESLHLKKLLLWDYRNFSAWDRKTQYDPKSYSHSRFKRALGACWKLYNLVFAK